MVHQAISRIKLNKKLIPIATVSSTLLLSLFTNTADAFNAQDGMIKNNPYAHSGTPNNQGNMFSIWITIGRGILKGFDWITHLNLHQLSHDLFIGIYQFLTNNVLATPIFIFNNPAVQSQIATFSGSSMFIVTILYMYQAIKRMIKQKKGQSDEPKFRIGDWKILKRYFIAMGASGAIPFLFSTGFKVINVLIKLLSGIGVNNMKDFNLFDSISLTSGGLLGLDTLLFLLFDGVLIGLLIPICLQVGRRWFNLMCLTGIAPLSLSAWIFDDTKDYFDMWWRSVKKLAQSQLVIAFYICVMGLFIFGTTVSGASVFPSLLLIIGGMFSLIDPPTFVRNKMNHFDNIDDDGLSMWSKAKGLYDTVTLRNLTTTKFLMKRKADKLKQIKALQKKHGLRYVKHLL
jgi:hypothetical protein